MTAENLSVNAQVKEWVKNLPIGTKINVHDLYKIFPKEDGSVLSAALSTLKNEGALMMLQEKIDSEWVVDGHLVRKKLSVYQIVRYPSTGNHAKPEPYTRAVTMTITKDPEPEFDPLAEGKFFFERAIAAAPSRTADENLIYNVAKKVEYLSDIPMFDTVVGDEYVYRFGHLIAKRLANFDPKKDVLVFYGDQIIISIATFYLAKRFDKIFVARWSMKKQDYVVREISTKMFL